MASSSNGDDSNKSSPAAEVNLDVIYSDDDIVVLNKPAGLRTVPGKMVGPDAETRAHVSFQFIVPIG